MSANRYWLAKDEATHNTQDAALTGGFFMATFQRPRPVGHPI
jgi:hypothetical protein